MPTIMIVEDDPLISRLYQKAFSFENYETVVATNGKEALEQLQTTQPTLILLDIMMPDMNGLEVLASLKQQETTKDIPVVVLTNLAGEQDVEEALSRGAVQYIVKSEHNPKEVVDMVKQVLAGYTRDDLPPVV